MPSDNNIPDTPDEPRLDEITSFDPSQLSEEVLPATRVGGDHFVADVITETIQVDKIKVGEKPSNLWLDAWRDLRKRPMFWLAVIIVLVVILMALWPKLFTHEDALYCDLMLGNEGASNGHPLGFTQQGCDVWSRIVHGASTSLSVGFLATMISSILGLIMGAIAGFYGGWLDSLLSRIGDIFFSIPYVLAAIVVMSVLSDYRNAFTMALAIGGFAWSSTARIMRAEVLRVRQQEYVMASRALGRGRFSTLLVHVIPNAIAPLVVVTTLTFAGSIVAEATLSFLGLGMSDAKIVSWGQEISNAQGSLTTAPLPLIYPSLMLTVTVLAFVILGELIRDALDPKARAQR